MESKFTELNDTMDKLRHDISACTKDGCKLWPDASTLPRSMDTTEKNSCKIPGLEVKLADLEIQSCHNDILIQGIPEGTEVSNACQCKTTFLPTWFPSLGDQKTMRAQHISLNLTTLLPHHDSSVSWLGSRPPPSGCPVLSPETLFLLDYSSHTLTCRRKFSTSIGAATKLGFQTFLFPPG